MYIVEEEADDPEGKKRRQVILKTADLQGSSEASETGATGTELSGSACGKGSATRKKGVHYVQPGAGAAVETLHVLRGLLQTLGFPSARRSSRRERGPGPPSRALAPHLHLLSYWRPVPSCYRSPPASAGVNPKTPSGCLKSQIV